jgi:hypothetical protein
MMQLGYFPFNIPEFQILGKVSLLHFSYLQSLMVLKTEPRKPHTWSSSLPLSYPSAYRWPSFHWDLVEVLSPYAIWYLIIYCTLCRNIIPQSKMLRSHIYYELLWTSTVRKKLLSFLSHIYNSKLNKCLLNLFHRTQLCINKMWTCSNQK